MTRNATFNSHGSIDCELDHPVFGWIPFTASLEDPEEHGRAIFDILKNTAAPYVKPEPPVA